MDNLGVAIERVNDKLTATILELSKLYSEGNLVSVSAMQEIPNGETVILAPGVISQRNDRDGKLSFDVNMDEHARLGLHFHDAKEIIYVQEGGLILDLNSRAVSWNTMVIEDNTLHEIIALKPSSLRVDFII